ncbi:transglycosylase SLT domain-containing protein [Dechloromonas sp. XY25]|uniref:Transglycosylase SLT domain-containing protein n=1 Tax=Dechloromonas hankyongensis TaxID=2908002 RepID=A0ABS9K1Y5_9RHOO|nr:transglycosylase SLT domain-containing protein [Dechloromonas hankyongensis]MCG2577197.1 transglycosylase SLT domain-containing protein [Dechloromonas hankyongensis]
MLHRTISSPLLKIRQTALSIALSLLATPALAQLEDQSIFKSLLMPSALEAPSLGDDTLTVQEIKGAPQLPLSIDLTISENNLWDRIRNGFAMADLNDDLVLHYQQWYQNRPDALRRMVERSRPYLHHIVEELEARGMPTELALLPMVESSFNPNAYSRAHASGLWQFIPATGKRFNLEQNWWRDERRDIVASTNAALDYLQTIYEMHGDWHLALASYNWGEGAVKKAIVKNESRGLPTDYPSLNMPNETRHYVPKLQALKNIFGNPALIARLGLPFIPNEPYFATLESPKPIDVKTAAQLANMTIEEFQRLNPSHNRPIIKPDTPVVIPADKLDTFRSNLHNSKVPLTQWQAYTVTSAERLEHIAARFDTTTAELARVNGLSEKVRLGAGSTLLVPGNGSTSGLTSLLNAPAPQHIIEPERVARACGKSAKRGAKPCATRDEPATAKGGKASKATLAKNEKVAAGGAAKTQPKAAGSKPAAKPAAGPAKGAKPAPKKHK